MRAFGLFLVAVAPLAAACGDGCDGGLVQLRPDLQLTPAHSEATAWIGHRTVVAIDVQNDGPVSLDVAAPTLVGAPAGFGASVTLTSERVEAARAARMEIAFAPAPTAVGQRATVTVVVHPLAGDTADASATVDVLVQEPPPCVATDPCEDAVFDPASGACLRTAHPDGEECSDGSACTEQDRCSAAVCVGRGITCADDVACTIDACDRERGCVFEPQDDRCSDGNPCTDDVCHPTSGCARTTSADGTPCGSFSCAQLEACALGTCVAMPTPDGFPCEDGDLCTVGDACAAQACVPGASVAPNAAPAVTLAPIDVEVVPDDRWFPLDEPVPSTLEPFTTPAQFNSVLDVAQGLTGSDPTLAVLWKSEPFGMAGVPCSPWATFSTLTAVNTRFCATAVVVTFINDAELASGAPGTSLVLEVAYGTVDGAFVVHDGAVSDQVTAVLAESTYAFGQREMRMHRETLSLATRAREAHSTELFDTPSVTFDNVHGGLRVAADDTAVALLAWELPAFAFGVVAIASADQTDAAGAAEPAPALAPPLDLVDIVAPSAPGGRGVMGFSPLLVDQCEPALAPALEDMGWRDVDVSVAGGITQAVVRHRPLASTEQCDVLDASLEGEALGILPASAAASLGDELWSVSLARTGDVIARVRPGGACPAVEGEECPTLVLEVRAQPISVFDPGATWSVPYGGFGTTRGSAAALDARAGVTGAVAFEDSSFTDTPVWLFDAVDTETPLVLASAPVVNVGPRVAALRSPLSPQRVYAVFTTRADPADLTSLHVGAVVPFGCPFPTPPLTD